MNFTGAIMALQYCEWFQSRKLPVPPQPIIDQLAEMMFRTLGFLQGAVLGVRDLRVLYLRAVDVVRTLIETVDRSLLERFKPFAGTALNIRRKCAFCQNVLPEVDMTALIDDEVEQSISADDNGQGPVCCAVCMELSYCDLSCQMSDAKRHRPCCIPACENFSSPKLFSMLVVGGDYS